MTMYKRTTMVKKDDLANTCTIKKQTKTHSAHGIVWAYRVLCTTKPHHQQTTQGDAANVKPTAPPYITHDACFCSKGMQWLFIGNFLHTQPDADRYDTSRCTVCFGSHMGVYAPRYTSRAQTDQLTPGLYSVHHTYKRCTIGVALHFIHHTHNAMPMTYTAGTPYPYT